MTKEQYLKIRKYTRKTMIKSLDSQHTFDHIERVRENALKIVELKNLQESVDLYLLQSMCLLQDLTLTKRRQGIVTYFLEGHFIKGIVKKALGQFELSKDEE